ncbi:MAG: hypothetical protein RML40_00040 [Bacteroidota bacterium]|nr:lipase family protein [Candidatus Kapabacteria bacterium]MDW8218896.1 hypothetical protein [Bacteroidota bacterium]
MRPLVHHIALTLVLILAYTALSCNIVQEPVCIPTAPEKEDQLHTHTESSIYSNKDASSIQSVPSGFTPHFAAWLQNNSYGGDNFSAIACYGGRTSASDSPSNEPVIFIHGNSDRALGTTPGQTGWSNSISYFLSQGYKSSELYAITWGPSNQALASEQYHSRSYLTAYGGLLKLFLLIQAHKKLILLLTLWE